MVVELRQHGLVGVVGQSIAAEMRSCGISVGQTSQLKVARTEPAGLQVRRQLKEIDPFIELHVFGVVNVQLFVRVDGHQQCADIRLHQSGQRIILESYFLKVVLERNQTHVNKVFAEALPEVAKEGRLCGFIQKDKILDPDPVPGSQGALHVQLTLCNKFSFKSAKSAALGIKIPFCI